MSILGTVLAFLAPAFMPAKALEKAFLQPEKVKADPHSIQGLIAWLETQDPKTQYVFIRASDCLWERYAKAMGYEAESTFHLAQTHMFNDWNDKHGTSYHAGMLPGDGDYGSIACGVIVGGNTYGQALKRARRHVS